MPTYDELSEKIQEMNQDIKFETVTRSTKKKLLEGKKGNHVSFFVQGDDYISDSNTKKIVCVRCTDEFFNIFFKDAKDENDEFMNEIFKMKQYMNWIPSEQVYKCPKCGKIEITRDPQIEDQPEKRLLGAGIENFPEYGSYLDPDSISGDFILTANSNKKKGQRSKVPFFQEVTEDELFDRYTRTQR